MDWQSSHAFIRKWRVSPGCFSEHGKEEVQFTPATWDIWVTAVASCGYLKLAANTVDLVEFVWKTMHIKYCSRSRCFEFSVQMSSLDAVTAWMGKPCSCATALLACGWEYGLQHVWKERAAVPWAPDPSGHACALVLQNSPVIFLKVRCSWHLFWKCHVYMPWHIYFFAIQKRDAFCSIHISIFFIQSGRSSNRQMFNFYMALVWNCLWLKISIGVRVSELMSVHFPSLFSNSVLAFNC